MPGIEFAGYKTPFTWNNFSPRAGLTCAVDEDRKTVARISFRRYAGQLNTGTVGVMNPSSVAGSATCRWVDGSGRIYINAKWQFNANAMYQAPYGIELSANVFGRQGYPFPIVRSGTARRSAPTPRSACWSRRRSIRSASRTSGTPICASRVNSAPSALTCARLSTCSTS